MIFFYYYYYFYNFLFMGDYVVSKRHVDVLDFMHHTINLNFEKEISNFFFPNTIFKFKNQNFDDFFEYNL